MAEKGVPNENKEGVLSPYEEESLEWYFCEGKSTFSRSVTGPMLTRAELYRHGSYPCYKCEGCGIVEETSDWCKRCNGTGFHSFELYKNDQDITAYPTAEVVEARGYEPSHEVLQRYGRVSRRLDQLVAKVGQSGLRALELFHGDSGMRWGRTKHGRLFALLPMTSAGRKILAKTETENDPVEMTACERIGVQVELQAAQPKAWRSELISLANKQAEELYQSAVKAWLETKPAKKNDRSAPTGERKKQRKTRRERKLEDRSEGTAANDAGLSLAEIREVAGFS